MHLQGQGQGAAPAPLPRQQQQLPLLLPWELCPRKGCHHHARTRSKTPRLLLPPLALLQPHGCYHCRRRCYWLLLHLH